MHEVLAQIGQNADIAQRPWWKQVIEAAKRFMINLGFTGMVKVSDIQDMVLHSLKVAAKPNSPEKTKTNQIGLFDGEPAFSRSPMKSVDANMSRGEQSMNEALINKADVKRAMYHNELGWIDFVWGDDYKGIQHIIKQRMAKDGLSVNDVYKLLTKDLVDTIASGEVIRKQEIPVSTKLVVAKGDYEAILVKNKGNNGWLLTGWKLKPSDAIKAGNDTKKAMQLKADSTDNKLGAEAVNELSAIASENVNSRMNESRSDSEITPYQVISDIPNQSWLEEQVNYAKEKGKNRWGVPYMGKITGHFAGKVEVPVSILSKLRGQRGEQDNVRDDSIQYLTEKMKQTGSLPISDVTGNPHVPYIEVAYDGSAWVNEGNHRIMVAKSLGMKTLPVEIRYFDGGERADGILSPSNIKGFAKTAFSNNIPDTITVNGIERPTLNSNGKPIYPTIEGIENFWRWFDDASASGGSKASMAGNGIQSNISDGIGMPDDTAWRDGGVLDSSGRPMVLYHGTRDSFHTFEVGHKNQKDLGWLEHDRFKPIYSLLEIKASTCAISTPAGIFNAVATFRIVVRLGCCSPSSSMLM